MTKTNEALTKARERDFDAGWRTAANWAQRDDLIADMDSKAFKADRAAALSAVDDGQARTEVLRAIDIVPAALLQTGEFRQGQPDLAPDHWTRKIAAPAPDASRHLIGYVSKIAEGAALFLPRPSLVTDGMVPVYDAPAPDAGMRPVAEVVSWTNGSYSRNYKLRWMVDVPEGTKLYAAPPQPAEKAVEADVRDALREFLDAQDALDNWELAGPNREDHDRVMRRRNVARHSLEAALASAPQADQAGDREASAIADAIVRDVAELPDYTSPDEWPNALMASREELRSIVLTHLATPPAASEGDGQ